MSINALRITALTCTIALGITVNSASADWTQIQDMVSEKTATTQNAQTL